MPSKTLTTKLDAINAMLDMVSERPVNTLDETGRLDVVRAVAHLEELSRKVQIKGWWFNTEDEVSILPSNGEYILADNVIKVDEFINNRKFVFRAGKMYNRITRTFGGNTEALKLNLVVLLDFEELPEAARQYIALRASVTFTGRRIGDPNLVVFAKEEASEAWIELQATQLEYEDFNISEAPEIARVMRR